MLVLVEVKQWSCLQETQLSRYRTVLQRSRVPLQRLVLLTTEPVTYEEGAERADNAITWPQVAGWLRKQVVADPVCIFLVRQLLEFLTQQGMTMEKVSWEYVNGVKAFRHLVGMIERALQLANIPIKERSAAWERMGFWLDEKAYWAGIYYAWPEFVYFVCHGDGYDRNKLREAGATLDDGPPYFELPLESEAEHFLSRTADSQLALIQAFLQSSYQKAQQCAVGNAGAAVAQNAAI